MMSNPSFKHVLASAESSLSLDIVLLFFLKKKRSFIKIRHFKNRDSNSQIRNLDSLNRICCSNNRLI
jgi:hypothetical protein